MREFHSTGAFMTGWTGSCWQKQGSGEHTVIVCNWQQAAA